MLFVAIQALFKLISSDQLQPPLLEPQTRLQTSLSLVHVSQEAKQRWHYVPAVTKDWVVACCEHNQQVCSHCGYEPLRQAVG